jgi:hypothetical protein
MPKSRSELAALYARRFQLWRDLVNQPDFVRGSVVELRRPCTRPHCPRCRAGDRHPATYLSFKQAGRTRLVYLPAAVQGQARAWVENYRGLMALIEEVCAVNREVLTVQGRAAAAAAKAKGKATAPARRSRR